MNHPRSNMPPMPVLLETPRTAFQECAHSGNLFGMDPYDDVPSTPVKPCRVMSPSSTKRLLLDRLEHVEVPSLSPSSLSPFKKLKRSLPLSLVPEGTTRNPQQQQHFQQALARLKNGQALQKLKSLKEKETKAKEEAEEWARQQSRQVFLNHTSHSSSSPSQLSPRSPTSRSSRDSSTSDNDVVRHSPLRSASYHPSSKPSLNGRAPPIRGRMTRRNSARAA
mmetsp:Transcript_31264/g.75592  ORF Transcript_31264/g.75592 Transcript_31264/m.75592 type:complete len:222 (+) Transcript_31264:606-1271(+)